MSSKITPSSDLKSNRYVTEHEVAELTGIAVQSLRNHRSIGRGFPYRKYGKSVRYFLPEILAIMESHRIDPEAM